LKNTNIVAPLLEWYGKNKRDLPWRKERDPYKIWLSEIILQQTRVDQGLPYYLAFSEKFPTIFDLAHASENIVLRAWQGLGYYSRARNLQKCAKIIAEQHAGVFPTTRKELIKLPGIGPYTSAAIASFAYGRKEAVVDGNVIRVISRLYGIEKDVSSQKTVDQISSIAESLISADHPDLFNQAIMEFGALHCTPKKPDCSQCIFVDSCVARRTGNVELLPFKSKKTKKRDRHFSYLMIQVGKKMLLRKRKTKDIWNGLFEFFLIENQSQMDFDGLLLPDALSNQAGMWKLIDESKLYNHVLSHQNIHCQFFHIKVSNKFTFMPSDWVDYKLYSNEEIELLPKAILIDRFLGEK